MKNIATCIDFTWTGVHFFIKSVPNLLKTKLSAVLSRPSRLLCALCVQTAVGSLAPAHAQTITDDLQARTTFAQPPQRIVSLLPALAESVCALGHCDKLVGVDRFTNWPESVKSVPKMGGGMDPNVEAIVAAKPDLVLMAKSTRAQDRLRALGVRVVSLEPMMASDVKSTLERLDALLNPGAPRAPAVWAGIRAQMARAAAAVPQAVRGQRVYFEAGSGLYAAGEASFIGETLKSLGLVNIVPPSMGPFPQIGPEYVVAANPDRIIASVRATQEMPSRPGWSRITALQKSQVCSLKPEQADIVVRPGPRMGEAALELAGCLKG